MAETFDPTARFRGMTEDEIRAELDVIDARLQVLHQNADGSLRSDMSQADKREMAELLGEREEAEKRQGRNRRTLDALNRHPGSVQVAFGGDLVPSHDAVPAVDVARMQPRDVRSAALRLLETRGKHLSTEQTDRVAKTMESELGPENRYLDGDYVARRMVITESDEYRSAFQQILTESQPLLTEAETQAVRMFRALESRFMGEWTPSAGGVGVPVTIDASILLQSGAAAAPLLAAARVVPVTSNIWRGVSSAPPAFTFQTEGADTTDNAPTLTQPSITVHMARSVIPYSIEISQDYPGFAFEMEQILTQGWTDLLAQKTIVSSGTGEPWGLLTRLDATTTSEVLLTTAGTLDGAQIFKAWNALPERFRSRASWLMSVSVESQIRSFGAAPVPSSYFTVDMTADGLTRLNGRPTLVTDYMPAFVGGTSHQNYLIAGDLQNYVIAMRQGLQVEPVQHVVSTTTGLPTGKRAFFAWGRWGADTSVTQGLRLLNQT